MPSVEGDLELSKAAFISNSFVYCAKMFKKKSVDTKNNWRKCESCDIWTEFNLVFLLHQNCLLSKRRFYISIREYFFWLSPSIERFKFRFNLLQFDFVSCKQKQASGSMWEEKEFPDSFDESFATLSTTNGASKNKQV